MALLTPEAGARLTRDEREEEAVRLIGEYRRTGETHVRDRVFYMFAPLARISVSKIRHPLQEEDDLVCEARMGLFAAIEQFDLERGCLFTTYAIAKMRYACIEYARHVIWGNRGMQTARRQAERRRWELEQGADPTLDEQLGGWPTGPAWLEPPLSMEQTVRAYTQVGVAPMTLADTIHAAIDCEFEALNRLFTAKVQEGLERLPERWRQVLIEYYWEGKTFREVGAGLGISESRAYQLHQQAMLRLRRWLDGFADPAPARQPAAA